MLLLCTWSMTKPSSACMSVQQGVRISLSLLFCMSREAGLGSEPSLLACFGSSTVCLWLWRTCRLARACKCHQRLGGRRDVGRCRSDGLEIGRWRIASLISSQSHCHPWRPCVYCLQWRQERTRPGNDYEAVVRKVWGVWSMQVFDCYDVLLP